MAENSALGDEICQERQLGFEQGIAQCHYFFKTPLNHYGFNIMNVYVDGQLVDLSQQMPATEEIAIVVPTVLENVPTIAHVDLAETSNNPPATE